MLNFPFSTSNSKKSVIFATVNKKQRFVMYYIFEKVRSFKRESKKINVKSLAEVRASMSGDSGDSLLPSKMDNVKSVFLTSH
jgi:hypothetical protein